MSRLFLICSCAIFVCSVALFSSNASGRERSLHPDELFRLYGGASFTDRCCLENDDCSSEAEGCTAGNDGDCATQTEAQQQGTQSYKCMDPDPDEGADCDHADETHIYLETFDCTWDFQSESCSSVKTATFYNPNTCNDCCGT
jgi:hypothetical protein